MRETIVTRNNPVQSVAELSEKLISFFNLRLPGEETLEETDVAIIRNQPLPWWVGFHVIDQADDCHDFQLILFGAKFPRPALAIAGSVNGESSIYEMLSNKIGEFLSGWGNAIVLDWKVSDEADECS